MCKALLRAFIALVLCGTAYAASEPPDKAVYCAQPPALEPVPSTKGMAPPQRDKVLAIQKKNNDAVRRWETYCAEAGVEAMRVMTLEQENRELFKRLAELEAENAALKEEINRLKKSTQ